MTVDLSGRVIAVIGNGDALQRAVAVECAEAGADIALATVHVDEEFAVNSIANEIWSIGREHFVTLLDALDPERSAAFADECRARLGRCDALVWTYAKPSSEPLDELASEPLDALALAAWQDAFRENLDTAYVAARAFAPGFEQHGGGTILFAAPEPPGDDLAGRAARAALESLAGSLAHHWQPRGVRVAVTEASAAAILAALA